MDDTRKSVAVERRRTVRRPKPRPAPNNVSQPKSPPQALPREQDLERSGPVRIEDDPAARGLATGPDVKIDYESADLGLRLGLDPGSNGSKAVLTCTLRTDGQWNIEIDSDMMNQPVIASEVTRLYRYLRVEWRKYWALYRRNRRLAARNPDNGRTTD